MMSDTPESPTPDSTADSTPGATAKPTEFPATTKTGAEAPRRRTPEELRAQKRRNLAIAWSLVAFMTLVFVVTIVRLQQNAAGLTP